MSDEKKHHWLVIFTFVSDKSVAWGSNVITSTIDWFPIMTVTKMLKEKFETELLTITDWKEITAQQHEEWEANA